MAVPYSNYAARIAALYKEALAALSTPVTADAKPYMLHWQETFPFVTVQNADTTVDRADVDEGEDFDTYAVTMIGRLYVAKLTDGYRGDSETRLLDWIPHLISYFNARELLQSATYPSRPDDLRFARLTGCSGVGVLQAPWAGEGVTAVGATFTHELTCIEIVEQVYL